MDWPTGQEVNRQPRALLSVLLIGAIAFVGWRYWTSTRPDPQEGTEIRISEVSTRGGTLIMALDTDPPTVNPDVTTGVPDVSVGSLVYDALTRIDENFQAVPSLAESWTSRRTT